jgi:hypothetical protein
MKDEEILTAKAEAQRNEKNDLLRQSTLALLCNIHHLSLAVTLNFPFLVLL